MADFEIWVEKTYRYVVGRGYGNLGGDAVHLNADQIAIVEDFNRAEEKYNTMCRVVLANRKRPGLGIPR